MTDLPLNLPEGVYLKSLVIDPDFKVVSETMQRAVCLLILSDDEKLKVNGISPAELIPQSTVAGAPSIAMYLNNITPYLVRQLNDRTTPSSEKPVANVVFSMEAGENDNTAKLLMTITMAKDNETESTVIYEYD